MFTKISRAAWLLTPIILSTSACREKSSTVQQPAPNQPSSLQPAIVPKGDGSEENPVRVDQDLTPPPEPIPDYDPHEEPAVPDTPEPKDTPPKPSTP